MAISLAERRWSEADVDRVDERSTSAGPQPDLAIGLEVVEDDGRKRLRFASTIPVGVACGMDRFWTYGGVQHSESFLEVSTTSKEVKFRTVVRADFPYHVNVDGCARFRDRWHDGESELEQRKESWRGQGRSGLDFVLDLTQDPLERRKGLWTARFDGPQRERDDWLTGRNVSRSKRQPAKSQPKHVSEPVRVKPFPWIALAVLPRLCDPSRDGRNAREKARADYDAALSILRKDPLLLECCPAADPMMVRSYYDVRRSHRDFTPPTWPLEQSVMDQSKAILEALLPKALAGSPYDARSNRGAWVAAWARELYMEELNRANRKARGSRPRVERLAEEARERESDGEGRKRKTPGPAKVAGSAFSWQREDSELTEPSWPDLVLGIQRSFGDDETLAGSAQHAFDEAMETLNAAPEVKPENAVQACLQLAACAPLLTDAPWMKVGALLAPLRGLGEPVGSVADFTWGEIEEVTRS